ncbi:Antibiotic biosynthesis monooxygenase [Rhodovastum atsumiense]|uniref:Antibiotic biosynthesis monooxygenase n=1 Tax=Rhodovastum atsumiense TaxID=504468 RepID=A0A5M6INJ9_9PROT|nr:antibiotic biosynthesis monooxygenase [Rhodovastum atsumiense]KAA5609138.1 antibiotic biosynthesis monooxygenase [Rhodovastum atsumiense]CAH2601255.1 Antibiotic biosynthesis monooxygenase [Rhodovastum atsumiense]
MFIAMNRFRIAPASADAFETVWTSRDSYLRGVPGFIAFHLLRGPAAEDHVLYASHTLWRSHADFEAWTQSEAFRAAHASAGGTRHFHLAPPQFEGFEVRQTIEGP